MMLAVALVAKETVRLSLRRRLMLLVLVMMMPLMLVLLLLFEDSGCFREDRADVFLAKAEAAWAGRSSSDLSVRKELQDAISS